MPRGKGNGSGQPTEVFWKIAAKRLGITLEEYAEKRRDHRWCCSCSRWRPLDRFGPDRSRPSGDGKCVECRLELDDRRERERYDNRIRARLAAASEQ